MNRLNVYFVLGIILLIVWGVSSSGEQLLKFEDKANNVICYKLNIVSSISCVKVK